MSLFAGLMSIVAASAWAQASTDSIEAEGIRFGTGGSIGTITEKMRITQDGLVGIGYQTPTTPLRVSGTAAMDAALLIPRSVTSAQGGGGNYIASGTTSISASNAGTLKFATGDTQRMVIDSSGNVGIGTTTPTTNLHVYTAASGGTANANYNEIVAEASGNGGITVLSGAASDGVLAFGDSGGGAYGRLQYNHAADYMALWTGNTERLRVNASGVGIGTTTPDTALDVNGQIVGGFGASTTGGTLDWNDATNARPGSGYSLLRGTTASNAPETSAGYFHPFSFEYGGTKDGSGNMTQFAIPYNTPGSYGIYFRTRYSGTWNNWHRIITTDSSGQVGISTTTPGYPLDVLGTESANYIARIYNDANSTTGHGLMIRAGHNTTSGAMMIRFYRPDGTALGSISQNAATTVAYNTSSDRRVKEQIRPTQDGLDKLMQIPVSDFSFIRDPSHTRVQGFIAQDLYRVYPEAVTPNGDDGVRPLGANGAPWQVDYGRLTPLVVRSIQQLKAENDNLRAEHAAELGVLRAELGALKRAMAR